MSITFASAAKRTTFTFTHRIIHTDDLAIISPIVAIEWSTAEQASTYTLWLSWFKRQLALTIDIKRSTL